MVQAEGESQQSQTGSFEDIMIVDDGPDADEDLLQWSDALDYDSYTRCAAHCCTNKTLPGMDAGHDLYMHHQRARSHS